MGRKPFHYIPLSKTYHHLMDGMIIYYISMNRFPLNTSLYIFINKFQPFTLLNSFTWISNSKHQYIYSYTHFGHYTILPNHSNYFHIMYHLSHTCINTSNSLTNSFPNITTCIFNIYSPRIISTFCQSITCTTINSINIGVK